MKINKKATSIAEAMVILVIIVTGVTGMYKIYMASARLEQSTNNKIKAISIAREGIEAMTNIRDTNWIIFSSDTKNCWNTFNYNNGCINNTSINSISNNGHYKIYKNSNDRWTLSGSTITSSDYTDSNYRNFFIVGLDSNGFYTQTGVTVASSNLKPLYTREIITNYTEDTNSDTLIDSNDEIMKITSLVQWIDASSKTTHKVKLETILSNWKK